MAYIPDEAIDRMTELSAGAWRLYCFLARCRNQKTGKCFPSVQVTMEIIGSKKSQTYEFRKELAKAGWAKFEGNNVTALFGFDIPGNRTTNSDNTEVKGGIPENRKVTSEIPENSDIPETFSDIPETFSDIPETHVRKNQQIEPANRTSKEEQDMSNGSSTAVSSPVQEVFNYWQQTLNHQQSKLTTKRKKLTAARLKDGYTVEQIKTAIDGCRASPFHMGQNAGGTVYDDLALICRDGEHLESFIARVNQPQNGGSNGRNQIPHRETHNERAARETAELIQQALTPSGSFDNPDSADAGETWLAADFSRL